MAGLAAPLEKQSPRQCRQGMAGLEGGEEVAGLRRRERGDEYSPAMGQCRHIGWRD